MIFRSRLVSFNRVSFPHKLIWTATNSFPSMPRANLFAFIAFISPPSNAFVVCPQPARGTQLVPRQFPSLRPTRRIQDHQGKNTAPSSPLFRTAALYQESDDSNSNQNQAQHDIEGVLEGISKQGAEKLSNVSLTERTKRALLAEQVEDQIFANIYELERCAAKDAKAIIAQTRILRKQYNELVSGEGSSMLNAVEAAMEDDQDGGDANSSEDFA